MSQLQAGIPITLTEVEWKNIVVPVLAQQPYHLVVVVLQKIGAVLASQPNGPDPAVPLRDLPFLADRVVDGTSEPG